MSEARGERPHARDGCPECHGTRTLAGVTDRASIAAWLDCTTCSAIPKRHGEGALSLHRDRGRR